MHGIYRFDDADDALTFMPTAVRRALDVTGLKLSLVAWQSMSFEKKKQLVKLGAADAVDTRAVAALLPGVPAISPITEPLKPPEISLETWSHLRPLDRYAIVKAAHKPEKYARAKEEILGNLKPKS